MFSFNPAKINWNNKIENCSFGEIYPYQKTPDDDRFVAKYVRVLNNSDLLGFIQEIVLGSSCKHKNVLTVRGFHIKYDQKKENWEVYIKLDRMECSLKSKIKHQYEQGKNFSQKEIINYFYEISCGLEYLHTQGIAHRNIEPSNILIRKNEEVKIADIGLGKFFDDETSHAMGTTKGTNSYTAPEILQKQDALHLKKKDLFKADVWSLGIVMAELCLLEVDIIDITKSGSLNEFNIIRKLRELEGKYDKVLLDLVANLLNSDPSKRSSLQDIQKTLFGKYGSNLKEFEREQFKMERRGERTHEGTLSQAPVFIPGSRNASIAHDYFNISTANTNTFNIQAGLNNALQSMQKSHHKKNEEFNPTQPLETVHEKHGENLDQHNFNDEAEAKNEQKVKEREENEKKKREEKEGKEKEEKKEKAKKEKQAREAEKQAAELAKKVEEKKFNQSIKNEVKIEIVIMSREQMEQAIQEIGKKFRDRKIPQEIEQ